MFSYPLLDHRQSQKPLIDAVCALLLWGTKDRKEPTVIFTYFLLNTYTIENRSLNLMFNNKEVIRIMWYRKKIYHMTLPGVIIISVLLKIH